MPLLEKGLEVYPELRHLILSTMYQLKYPITKWYFGSPDDDSELLEYAIDTGRIGCKLIAGHLGEIVALYPLTIMQSLVDKKIATTGDVCTMEVYHKACGLGRREYLGWPRIIVT